MRISSSYVTVSAELW